MFASEVTAARDAMFEEFGTTVTYFPDQGTGAAVTTLVILLEGSIEEPGSPGYFADVEVRPADVPSPQRKDEVVWGDGTVYVVSRVSRPGQWRCVVALHKKNEGQVI
jgi:hypothetical protein